MRNPISNIVVFNAPTGWIAGLVPLFTFTLFFQPVAVAQGQKPDLQIDSTQRPFSIPTPKRTSPFNTPKEEDPLEPENVPREEVPPPIVENDMDLPKVVRDLKAALITAARSGDVETLRPFIEIGSDGTQLSINADYEDPIAFLKESSPDGEALETMAILIDILSSRPVHYAKGTQEEAYIWPYFWGRSLNDLKNKQLVELFQILTFGDFGAMVELDTYFFYRLGISPEGKLLFFVSGD